MIKNIKEIHKNDVCLFKMGSFYHAFNRDAYILSYLCGYKLKRIEQNSVDCGFPTNVALRIRARLEENNINYLLIDRRNDFEVDEKEDFGNNNKYDAIYEKAKRYVNFKFRIENIQEFLMENIENNGIKGTIQKIEEIITEDEAAY